MIITVRSNVELTIGFIDQDLNDEEKDEEVKKLLPQSQDGSNTEVSWSDFKEKLQEYKNKLDIGFAIDDFGVGYASVYRLANLNLPHVKIDRDLLYHKDTEIIIHFVHQLARQNRTDVVIEGLDDNSPISLHQLKEIGVKYIQGFIVAQADAEVYERIDQDKAKFLIERMMKK